MDSSSETAPEPPAPFIHPAASSRALWPSSSVRTLPSWYRAAAACSPRPTSSAVRFIFRSRDNALTKNDLRFLVEKIVVTGMVTRSEVVVRLMAAGNGGSPAALDRAPGVSPTFDVGWAPAAGLEPATRRSTESKREGRTSGTLQKQSDRDARGSEIHRTRPHVAHSDPQRRSGGIDGRPPSAYIASNTHDSLAKTASASFLIARSGCDCGTHRATLNVTPRCSRGGTRCSAGASFSITTPR